MGNAVKKLFALGIFLSIAIFIFYISLPFIFAGSAAPLFVIHNHDVRSHEVRIEVFDQQNKSIINETFSL